MPQTRGETALHSAARHDQPAAIETLLAGGANVNARVHSLEGDSGRNGCSVARLHTAASVGSAGLGGAVDGNAHCARDDHAGGATPLLEAARQDKKCVRLLLQAAGAAVGAAAAAAAADSLHTGGNAKDAAAAAAEAAAAASHTDNKGRTPLLVAAAEAC